MQVFEFFCSAIVGGLTHDVVKQGVSAVGHWLSSELPKRGFPITLNEVQHQGLAEELIQIPESFWCNENSLRDFLNATRVKSALEKHLPEEAHHSIGDHNQNAGIATHSDNAVVGSNVSNNQGLFAPGTQGDVKQEIHHHYSNNQHPLKKN